MKTTGNSQISQRDVLVGFAQETTAHGLSRLSHGPSYKRFVWLLIVIGATGGFIAHLMELIQRYYEYPVNTEFLDGTEPVLFPAVTICPTFFMNTYSLIKNVSSIYEVPYYRRRFYDIIFDVPRFWHHIKNSTGENVAEPYGSYYDARISLKQIAYRGRQLQESFDTMVYCRYNSKRCSYRNFTDYKDPETFLCHTFVPDNQTVVTSGEGSGLYLMLYYYGTAFLTEEEEVDDVPGFLATLHDPGTRPDLRKSFRVPMRKKVTAAMSSVKRIKVNREPAPCVSHIPKVTYTLDWSTDVSHNQTFKGTTEDCKIRAKHLEFLKTCRCVADHLPIPTDIFPQAQTCHNLFEKVYFRDIHHATYNGTLEYIIKNDTNSFILLSEFINQNYDKINGTKERIDCFHNVDDSQTQDGIQAYCPQVCNTNEYPVSIVYADWPRNHGKAVDAITYFMKDTIEKMAEDNLTSVVVDQLKALTGYRLGYFAVLDLYPASITTTVLKEDWAYLLRNLFSDLGGILGLWVGVSIITIAEILELLWMMMYLSIYKLRMNRSIQPTPATVNNDENLDLSNSSTKNSQNSKEAANVVRSIYDHVDVIDPQNAKEELARDMSLPPPAYSVTDAQEKDVVQYHQAWFQKLFSL